MSPRAGILTFFFLIAAVSLGEGTDAMGLISMIEDRLEIKLGEFAKSFTGWLESFNDNHIGRSELGRFIQYDEIKPKFEDTANKQSRGMKKWGQTLVPLIFHVGATSTWMLLTTLLAAKSVAIGLALLVFKIAVSSAKVASFFTALKGQKHEEGYSWAPHHDHHHGHYRSLNQGHHAFLDHLPSHDNSYVPEWTPSASSQYATIAKDPGPGPYTYSEKKEAE